VSAEERFITVASTTTSTEESGLFRHLLPAFEKASGIRVRVVALGTGQALDLARRGDADVVFVHDPAAEEQFIAEGHGVQRRQVMYNDFVLVGPRDDPAGSPVGTSSMPSGVSRRRVRHSSHAAIAAARTRPNCVTGHWRASIWKNKKGRGTAPAVRAWARRSISPPR
jgi:ABC-type tungstate transport system permease subunit